MDSTLYRRSIEIILQGQAASGAYIASPNFSTYLYSWLRDGSFIAHSMDCAKHTESAAQFFRWVSRTIGKHAEKVDRVTAALAAGKPLKDSDFLHTRYTVDGREVTEDDTWGNFQYDGYGTWLWALNEHLRMGGDPHILEEVGEAVVLTTRYLSAVWMLPGYDCWEEHPEYLHPYSLAAAYAGIRAAANLVTYGVPGLNVDELNTLADQIASFVRKNGELGGRLTKSIGISSQIPMAAALGVDASLIAVATPYGLYRGDEKVFAATFAEIERDLHRPGGGVYRYTSDVYYGGGEWILLAAWLGWHYARCSQPARAMEIARWIESQADADSNLPEQVSQHLLHPEHLKPWQAKWGPVASPLLWSHAMYLILIHALEKIA